MPESGYTSRPSPWAEGYEHTAVDPFAAAPPGYTNPSFDAPSGPQPQPQHWPQLHPYHPGAVHQRHSGCIQQQRLRQCLSHRLLRLAEQPRLRVSAARCCYMGGQ